MERTLRRKASQCLTGGMDHSIKFRGPVIISKRGTNLDGPGGTIGFDLGLGGTSNSCLAGPGIIS